MLLWIERGRRVTVFSRCRAISRASSMSLRSRPRRMATGDSLFQMPGDFESLFDVIAEQATQDGDVVAGIDAIRGADEFSPLPRVMTYANLYDAACRLAGPLRRRLMAPQAVHGTARGQHALAPTALVTCMRRGNEWYAVYAAGMLLGNPVVGLSKDLSDAVAERRRNVEILRSFCPKFLVVDVDGVTRIREVKGAESEDHCEFRPTLLGFRELWLQADGNSPPWQPTMVHAMRGDVYGDAVAIAARESALCFCYTGGTTKAAKCAVATHAMALSEVRGYPEVCAGAVGPGNVALQQHSVYWGASCYGEVDIALSFRCALLFSVASGPEEVRSAIQVHNVSVAGLVPAVLSGLEPEHVPSLRLIFTWGETLSARTAQRWARAGRRVIDLLISTECWLGLYADWETWVRDGCGQASGKTRPPFQAVRDATVCLGPAPDGVPEGAGELLLSGPMVFPGYLEEAESRSAFRSTAHHEETAALRRLCNPAPSDGSRTIHLYCTKDLAMCAENGIQYLGRCDDMAKVAGEWVDVSQLEAMAADVAPVAEAAIRDRQLFVAIPADADVGLACVSRLRRKLPTDFGLFCLVDALPRHPATGKVDRAALQAIAGTAESRLRAIAAADAKMATEELIEYIRWYAPLGMVAGAAFLHAVFATGVALPHGLECFGVIRFALLEMPGRFLALAYLRLAQIHATSFLP